MDEGVLVVERDKGGQGLGLGVLGPQLRVERGDPLEQEGVGLRQPRQLPLQEPRADGPCVYVRCCRTESEWTDERPSLPPNPTPTCSLRPLQLLDVADPVDHEVAALDQQAPQLVLLDQGAVVKGDGHLRHRHLEHPGEVSAQSRL